MSKLFQDILQQATGLTSEEQLALISQLSQQLAGSVNADPERKDSNSNSNDKELPADWWSAFYSLKMRFAE
ncbi:MAG: hypothetical protein MRZ79_10895 [Bacteroidia bacterium]|nr:hypothetical protein [Bacteroidia bacterium]